MKGLTVRSHISTSLSGKASHLPTCDIYMQMWFFIPSKRLFDARIVIPTVHDLNFQARVSDFLFRLGNAIGLQARYMVSNVQETGSIEKQIDRLTAVMRHCSRSCRKGRTWSGSRLSRIFKLSGGPLAHVLLFRQPTRNVVSGITSPYRISSLRFSSQFLQGASWRLAKTPLKPIWLSSSKYPSAASSSTSPRKALIVNDPSKAYLTLRLEPKFCFVSRK